MILSVDTTKDTPAELRAAAALILSFANDRDASSSQHAHPFPPPHEEHHTIPTFSREQNPAAAPSNSQVASASKPRRIADLLAEVAQEPAEPADEDEEMKPRTAPVQKTVQEDKPVVRRIPPGVQVY